MSCYAGIELACLDACGRATGRRFCELVGGPVRDPVEFAAYLFYRYAADHPVILSDPHLVDSRGRGDRALDSWGEVRTPEAMADHGRAVPRSLGLSRLQAQGGRARARARSRDLEGDVRPAGPRRPLRIDPNGRWKTATAIRIGNQIKQLPMEYYEDPVQGQAAMAEVRRETGLKMSTNMCVTSFAHIPEAPELETDRRFAVRSPLFRRLRRLPGTRADLQAGRLDDEPAQQQSRRRHHGRDDPSGRVDSRAHAGQRHALSLADRGHRHHRGAKAGDPGRQDGHTRRAQASVLLWITTNSRVHTKFMSSVECAGATTDR